MPMTMKKRLDPGFLMVYNGEKNNTSEADKMKIVIQRVLKARVEVAENTVGEIGRGFLILFGAAIGDTEADATRLAAKISKLRIFEDENGKTNLSIMM